MTKFEEESIFYATVMIKMMVMAMTMMMMLDVDKGSDVDVDDYVLYDRDDNEDGNRKCLEHSSQK